MTEIPVWYPVELQIEGIRWWYYWYPEWLIVFKSQMEANK